MAKSSVRSVGPNSSSGHSTNSKIDDEGLCNSKTSVVKMRNLFENLSTNSTGISPQYNSSKLPRHHGSTVKTSVVRRYPGPKISTCTSQHSVKTKVKYDTKNDCNKQNSKASKSVAQRNISPDFCVKKNEVDDKSFKRNSLVATRIKSFENSSQSPHINNVSIDSNLPVCSVTETSIKDQTSLVSEGKSSRKSKMKLRRKSSTSNHNKNSDCFKNSSEQDQTKHQKGENTPGNDVIVSKPFKKSKISKKKMKNTSVRSRRNLKTDLKSKRVDNPPETLPSKVNSANHGSDAHDTSTENAWETDSESNNPECNALSFSEEAPCQSDSDTRSSVLSSSKDSLASGTKYSFFQKLKISPDKISLHRLLNKRENIMSGFKNKLEQKFNVIKLKKNERKDNRLNSKKLSEKEQNRVSNFYEVVDILKMDASPRFVVEGDIGQTPSAGHTKSMVTLKSTSTMPIIQDSFDPKPSCPRLSTSLENLSKNPIESKIKRFSVAAGAKCINTRDNDDSLETTRNEKYPGNMCERGRKDRALKNSISNPEGLIMQQNSVDNEYSTVKRSVDSSGNSPVFSPHTLDISDRSLDYQTPAVKFVLEESTKSDWSFQNQLPLKPLDHLQGSKDHLSSYQAQPEEMIGLQDIDTTYQSVNECQVENELNLSNAPNDYEIKEDTDDVYRSHFDCEPLYQYTKKDLFSFNINSDNDDDFDYYSDDEFDDIYEFENSESNQSSISHVNSFVGSNASKNSNLNSTSSDPGYSSPNSMNQRSLWCEMAEVIDSGVLDEISESEKKLQEAFFEVITSEASYYRSLNILYNNFFMSPELNNSKILSVRDRDTLFSNIASVRRVSEKFLFDLESRWSVNHVIHDISDIIIKHSSESFEPYVSYCSNKMFQDRKYSEIKKNPDFSKAIQTLERKPDCHRLSMFSFLLLPMQRITRLPLLMDAIYRYLPDCDSRRADVQRSINSLNKVVKKCNNSAKNMERMEELLLIDKQLKFSIKTLPIVSPRRYLIKRGGIVQLTTPETSRKSIRNIQISKKHRYLFLFNDILLITKKKSDEIYAVIDYCPRSSIHAQVLNEEEITRLFSGTQSHVSGHIFLLALLDNHLQQHVDLYCSAKSLSDLTRWIDAIRPPSQSTIEGEKIYEDWDCCQVQAMQQYQALQADELSLEKSDVVNITHKMPDGWYEGQRIRDGERGWFPSSCVIEIDNYHVRSRNLQQLYRLTLHFEQDPTP